MNAGEHHNIVGNFTENRTGRTEMILAIAFGSLVLGFLPIALLSNLPETEVIIPAEAQLWAELAEKDAK